MAIACGDCFRWASQRALKAFSKNEPLVVVHATVQPDFGINANGDVYPNRKRYDHAWIERRGKVLDWQTVNSFAVNADGTQRKRMHLWPVGEFYYTMLPKDIQKYTPEQAALLPMRTGNYGPWSDAERREHADLMARVASRFLQARVLNSEAMVFEAMLDLARARKSTDSALHYLRTVRRDFPVARAMMDLNNAKGILKDSHDELSALYHRVERREQSVAV